MTALVILVGLGIALYGTFAAGMYLYQRRLIYRPDRVEVELDVAVQMGGRWIRAASADGLETRHLLCGPLDRRPVVVFFHGNAGHAGHRAEKAAALCAAGVSVLVVGYRGFGGNPGRPSEDGIYSDARGALDWLARAGVDPNRTVLYGESLGTGVASKMAEEGRGAALILEAPFTSITDIARSRYWYLPVDFLLRDRFDTVGRMPRIDLPVLILHGDQDAIVPVDHGRTIARSAVGPMEIVVFPGGGHTDLYDIGARDVVSRFIRTHLFDVADAMIPAE